MRSEDKRVRKTVTIILSIIGTLMFAGYLLVHAYARDEVQWVYMAEMRSDYFPDYYIVNGKWPKDLSGVREFFKLGDHPGRETLIWLIDQNHPNIDVQQNSRERFSGKLDFHSFLGSHYDVNVTAPTDQELESRYEKGISEEYVPAFSEEHHKWPNDLSGVKPYYGAMKSLHAAAMVKLNDKLQPKLIVKKSTTKEFEAAIQFHGNPAESIDILGYSP